MKTEFEVREEINRYHILIKEKLKLFTANLDLDDRLKLNNEISKLLGCSESLIWVLKNDKNGK